MKKLLTGCMAGLLLCGAAEAAIVGTTGSIVQIAPPATLQWQAFESNTQIRALDELQDQVLGASLAINIDGTPGSYENIASLTGGMLPSGTLVDSHLLHFDPASGSVNLRGTITFDNPIVGVILLTNELFNSDFLGAAGTTYPAAPLARRGLDLTDVNLQDSVAISTDRLTLTVDLGAANVIDQIRVLTIPEPMSAGLLGVAALALCARRPARRG